MGILIGGKKSNVTSSLADFEAISPEKFNMMANSQQVPNGFLFVVGVSKYKKNNGRTFLRCGKDLLFMQNFLPHQKDDFMSSRGFGQIYSLYEPDAEKYADDVVLSESAIYQRDGDRVMLILADGECRNRKCVAEMFEHIRRQKNLLDFAPKDSLPRLYKVTFKKKSCGYFLKDRTYYVFATPVGIPDVQSGEVNKGWLFCDINCGVPAIIPRTREAFVALNASEGDKVSMFNLRDDTLVYEEF